MMNTKKTLVFLAGGMGSRYKALKQVDGMLDNGSPIMEYSFYDALQAGFNKFVFIISEAVPREYIDKISRIAQQQKVECIWIIQRLSSFVENPKYLEHREKPWGTGHALLCAKEVVKENFLIVNADDFYGKKSFETAAELCKNGSINEENYAIVSYLLKNTLSKNGSVSRGLCAVNSSGFLTDIEELTQIKSENNQIFAETEMGKRTLSPEDLVSMNFWVFHPSIFQCLENGFKDFLSKNPGLKTEYILPEVVRNHLHHKEIAVQVVESDETWKGVTYPQDKEEVRDFLEQKIKRKIYPEHLWI